MSALHSHELMRPLALQARYGVFLIGSPSLFPKISTTHISDASSISRLVADPLARTQLRQNLNALYLGTFNQLHISNGALGELLRQAVWRHRLHIVFLPSPGSAAIVATNRAGRAATPSVKPPVAIAAGVGGIFKKPETDTTLAVAAMSPIQKIEAALGKSPAYVTPELRRALAGLASLETLRGIAEICLLVLAAQAAGVGATAIDLALLAYAYSIAGWQGFLAGYEFIYATIDATKARTASDIDAAAKRYAKAFVKLGEAFAAWLLARSQAKKSTGGKASAVEDSPNAKGEQESLPGANTPSTVVEQPPIKITDKGWQHVVDRHIPGGPLKFSGKSKFNVAGDSLKDLIKSGSGQRATQQEYGNFARTWDTGRDIGFDMQSGKSTSIITVITKSDGSLVTAFPGRPTGGM